MVRIKKGGASTATSILMRQSQEREKKCENNLLNIKEKLRVSEEKLRQSEEKKKQLINKIFKKNKNNQKRKTDEESLNNLIKQYKVTTKINNKLYIKAQIKVLSETLKKNNTMKKLNNINKTKTKKKSLLTNLKSFFKKKSKTVPQKTGGSKRKYTKNPLTGRKILKNGRLARKLKKNNIL